MVSSVLPRSPWTASSRPPASLSVSNTTTDLSPRRLASSGTSTSQVPWRSLATNVALPVTGAPCSSTIASPVSRSLSVAVRL